jgi:hypothetical protein
MKNNPIFQDITNRIHRKGENCVIVFVGKVRKGKSFCSLELAKYVDKDFRVDTNCVYTTEDYFKLVNTDRECYAIVIEELGLRADKRRFMSLQNIILRHSLQTFGYKQICLIMNCPSMAFVDGSLEHMVDYVFSVDRAFKKGKLLHKTRFKVKKYQHNPEIGKTYRKRPFFWVNGKKVLINKMTIPVPDEATIQEYKLLSTEYKDKVGLELQAKSVEEDDADKAKQEAINIPSDDEIIKDILSKKKKLAVKYKSAEKYISSNKIRGIHNNISRRKAEMLAARINNILQGIIPPPVTCST